MAVGNGTTVMCTTMVATSNGVWQGDVPTHFALPLLIVQICLVLAVSRTLAFFFKPLKQPRVIAEVVVSSAIEFLGPIFEIVGGFRI